MLFFACFVQIMNMYGDLVMDSVPEKVRTGQFKPVRFPPGFRYGVSQGDLCFSILALGSLFQQLFLRQAKDKRLRRSQTMDEKCKGTLFE